jgi:hypothetical protein
LVCVNELSTFENTAQFIVENFNFLLDPFVSYIVAELREGNLVMRIEYHHAQAPSGYFSGEHPTEGREPFFKTLLIHSTFVFLSFNKFLTFSERPRRGTDAWLAPAGVHIPKNETCVYPSNSILNSNL